MEWLINRRRMMFNRAVPPEYMTFEDSAVWETVVLKWGDYNEIVVTDNGDDTVNIVTTYVSQIQKAKTSQVIVKKRVIVDTETAVPMSEVELRGLEVGTNKEPVGITLKQIQAVYSWGSAGSTPWNNLGNDRAFTELQYFTGLQNGYIARCAGTTFAKLKFPYNLVNTDAYTAWMRSTILDFPSTLTNISFYFWHNLLKTTPITLIFRSTTPPTVGTYNQKFANIAVIYVPSEAITAYAENTDFSYFANKLQPIEGSDYEVFNGWEYND